MTVRERMRLAVLAAALLPCLARAQATTPPADAAAQPAAPAAAAPSDAAAQPAPAAPAPATPAPVTKPAAPAKPPMVSSWAGTFYGFVEFDISYDTTQSVQEGIGGNPTIARPGTNAAKHGRTVFTGRNSRFGYRLSAPEYEGIKATGVIEADFEGNQPSNPPSTSEYSYYVNGTLRLRQANVKLENRYVDVLMGQTWALFGWQSFFFPATVFNLGGPWAEPFNRSAQLRLSKTIKTASFVFDIAAAAVRPPQRDAEIPDLQAGVRLGFAGWKGLHTPGFGGTTADPLTIGLSGATRKFRISTSTADPLDFQNLDGNGFSVDAIIPIIPVPNADQRGNALTIVASYASGTGISDLLGNIAGNVSKVANPAAPAINAATSIDPGLVVIDTSGKGHTVTWNGYLVGAQYYLPPSGRLWVSANYALGQSPNVYKYLPQSAANAATVWKKNLYYDANVFFDFTPAVRTGLSYEHLEQTYADDVKAKNDRYQMTTCFFF